MKTVEQLDRELGTPPKPSIEDAPKLKLNKLPAHLWYVYLGYNATLTIILSS